MIDAPTQILAYCRAGFESECAQELAAFASRAGVTGHIRAQRDSAFAEFAANAPVNAAAWQKELKPRELIFARQCLFVFAHLRALPQHDRVTPILQTLRKRGERYADIFVEAPDTNDGKALAPFCRSFGNALIGAAKREGLLDAKSAQRLHAFFSRSDEVYLCTVSVQTGSPWPQGIVRLKFPREAPSRSTLKLDEAFLTLLSEAERARWLQPGMHAADLGAAPGGWTWQLVRRGLLVIAVDNGPMDTQLMQSGKVTHVREDGFRYRPTRPVDWLVCDMVEQPRRVAALIAQWLSERRCEHAMFNLKLPMKKRYEETCLCLDLVHDTLSTHGADVRARQLYHDREEITVFARRRD